MDTTASPKTTTGSGHGSHQGGHHHDHDRGGACGGAGASGAAGAVDPVCGMTVKRDGNPRQVEHAGETYFFCSDH